MLGDISVATNIFIVTGYTDMRKSIDGLCASYMIRSPQNHLDILYICSVENVVIASKFSFTNLMDMFYYIKDLMLFKGNTVGHAINQKSEVSPGSNLTG